MAPMTQRTTAFTLIEVLLAAAVLLLAAATFASLNAQAARSITQAQLSTTATDALKAAAQAIRGGNSTYTQTRTLTSADLALLSEPDGRATRVLPSLSGTITANGGNPPTYTITITGPDFTITAPATAPGGTP